MTLPSRIDYLSISSNENKWTQAKNSFYGDSVSPEMKLAEKQPGTSSSRWVGYILQNDSFSSTIILTTRFVWVACGQICQFSFISSVENE